MALLRPSREAALDAVRIILAYIGEDPSREGLLATPNRFLKAWEEEWGSGYREVDFVLTDFDNVEHPADQMVFLKNISFFSFCEHHIALFHGEAHVAYLPKHRIVGASKLARIVKHFAARLQVQERLTAEVADFIADHISPDCAVSLTAHHTCMGSRGVRDPNVAMITTALRGTFRKDASAQDEFLRTVRNGS